jgi:hypothetical protein
MTLPAEIQSFYTEAGAMTGTAAHPNAFAGVTREPADMASTIQGFLLHEHWAPAYEQKLTPERRAESQLRSTDQMLTATLAHDPEPVTSARAPSERTVGVCRHFSVLGVAMLRARGIPARARCGFGAYFRPGTFEDHWVVEMWDGARWKLYDMQLDALQQKALKLDFDPQDVPRNRFIIAGDAWQQCRSGRNDPKKFGIFDMRGYWFIAGNVVRDAAALNNMEMLPWDCWGAAAESDDALTAETLAFLDRVAAVTLDPDNRFAELRQLYRDERLHVPPQVFNALTRQVDVV